MIANSVAEISPLWYATLSVGHVAADWFALSYNRAHCDCNFAIFYTYMVNLGYLPILRKAVISHLSTAKKGSYQWQRGFQNFGWKVGCMASF